MASLNERLLKAVKKGKVDDSLDEIAALLDQDADIEALDVYGNTPLRTTIINKWEAAAIYLMNRGASVHVVTAQGETMLHFACERGLEAVVRELLKRGADIEAKASYEYRPLHTAAWWGRENIVRLLVNEHGAQINARDEVGVTPLMAALMKGNEGIASFLLSAGADASISDMFSDWTALHQACTRGFTSIVVKLIDESGLDLQAKTKQGESCLHLAASRGRVGTCRLLLERGFPVDEVDEDGRSPLIGASTCGGAQVAELLLDHGADIERRDDKGYTPLSFALQYYGEQVVILLLERGARLDVPTPAAFKFAFLDEGMARTLEHDFLKTLFAEPDTPIPSYRRVLRWALTSPGVAELAKRKGWTLFGTAKTEGEAEEMREKRLSLLREDAWKRRMHLVIDRALDWGYGDEGEVPVLQTAMLDEKPEERKEQANAGAGKSAKE